MQRLKYLQHVGIPVHPPQTSELVRFKAGLYFAKSKMSESEVREGAGRCFQRAIAIRVNIQQVAPATVGWMRVGGESGGEGNDGLGPHSCDRR